MVDAMAEKAVQAGDVIIRWVRREACPLFVLRDGDGLVGTCTHRVMTKGDDGRFVAVSCALAAALRPLAYLSVPRDSMHCRERDIWSRVYATLLETTCRLVCEGGGRFLSIPLSIASQRPERYVSAGELQGQVPSLLRREQEQGDNFYVIETGIYAASIKGRRVFVYEHKGAFGELALMYNCPRAATVQARLCKCRAEASCQRQLRVRNEDINSLSAWWWSSACRACMPLAASHVLVAGSAIERGVLTATLSIAACLDLGLSRLLLSALP